MAKVYDALGNYMGDYPDQPGEPNVVPTPEVQGPPAPPEVQGPPAPKENELEEKQLTTGNEGTAAPSTNKKNPGHVGENKPDKKAQLKKTRDNNTGSNSKLGGPELRPKDEDANAQDKTRDAIGKENKGKHTDPTNPTAGSQDPSKNIHDALMGADPQQAAAVLKKALQAMVMLKMMDKLTSPAGILKMAAGGIGGGLAGLAGGFGMGAIQNALNGAMGGIAGSNLLPRSQMQALQYGMMGMMSGVPQGHCHHTEIMRAADTAYTLRTAMNEIRTGSPYAVDSVASFGGYDFGLTPGSLESRIALLGPGGTLRTTSVINGVRVNTVVYTNPYPQYYHMHPKLNGLEHVAISVGAISDVAAGVSNLLGVDSPVGNALGDAANVLADASDIVGSAGALSRSISNFHMGGVNSLASTATNTLGRAVSGAALASAIGGNIGNIIDGGLSKILGVNTGGLLGAVGSLLPGIAGNIKGTISNHLPKTSLSAGNINNLMQQHTKSLALTRSASAAAKNIFGKAQAESIASMAGQASLIASKVGSFSVTTPFGDQITASVANAVTNNRAGSAIGTIAKTGIAGIR